MTSPEKLLKALTLKEKIRLAAGSNFMYTASVKRLGIPALSLSDGPNGVRWQEKRDNGFSPSAASTCFPSASAAACSWDCRLLARIGKAIGEECRCCGADILLGPSVNIKRSPLGGRNFEYFSEDPLLTGALGAAFVKGLQSEGVGAAVKHLALNNSENYRFMGNSIADERAIREIYLPAFERIVKEARPLAVMTAYNRINGAFSAENRWLLQKVLREEWGFDGLTMSDWGGVADRTEALKSGLDLEMPGGTAYWRRRLLDAVRKDPPLEKDLDRAVGNLLRTIGRLKEAPSPPPREENRHALAIRAALESAVLLKNDGVLPLSPKEPVLVLGGPFIRPHFQGAGSAMLNPARLSSPKDAFDARGIRYRFRRGYRQNRRAPDPLLIGEALQAAKGFKNVLIFGGLIGGEESEGRDRRDMTLPAGLAALAEALADAGKAVTLVLYSGTPVELPFASKLKAVLYMGLPGQGGGEAAARLLFGEASPCGKLAETWPVSLEDVPFFRNFGRRVNELYKESIFVGYRYYATAGVKPLYPFGYGLSYTRFAYSSPVLKREKGLIRVFFTLKNTGARAGGEIVQLYVENNPDSAFFKARRELKAFQKVFLRPGEERRVCLSFKEADLACWDPKQGRWVVENGLYTLGVAASSEDIRLTLPLSVTAGESCAPPYPPLVRKAYDQAALRVSRRAFEALLGGKIPRSLPPLPLHMESPFTDFQYTPVGNLLYRGAGAILTAQLLKAGRLSGIKRENAVKSARFLSGVINGNSPRSLFMSAGGSFPHFLARAMVGLSNPPFSSKKGKG